MDEVIVTEYNPHWPEMFAAEAVHLRAALAESAVAVEHVGSTAVPGLAAKPVIDILVGVRAFAGAAQAALVLAALGYECRGENGIPGRLFFRKGLVQYRRTHHLHMVEMGHEQWVSLLSFRDALRADPDRARQYADLKGELAARFAGSRKAYTEGKTAFIEAVLETPRG